MSRITAFVALVLSLFLFSSPAAVHGQTEPAAALANDIAILNFALTLENADSTFFSSFLAAYNSTGFTQQQFITAGYNASVYTELVLLAQEEIAHTQILAATITALGGTPVPKCVYNFSAVTGVTSYLQTGLIFETTGTGAYDGGLNAITNSTIQQATATIATVEARHASYLLTVLGQLPFAVSAFDAALTPAQVYAAISPFIVSCPYNVTNFPAVPRPYGVSLAAGTNGSALTTNYTGLLARTNNTYTQADLSNDINTLNYALILENLESAFYNYSNTQFNAAAFAAAGYNSSVYSTFVAITSNEAIHVATLRTVISSFGAVPNPPCNYAPLFALVTSVQSYISVAQLLENTGVSAYDGAINAFASTALQTVAATIATIEARHATFLNTLVTGVPFPNNTDTALTPLQVATAVSTLQVCSFTPTLPTVARLQAPLVTVLVPSVRGDPQFVGLRGQSFQVHGIDGAVYNLITDSNTQVNSRFVFLTEGECPVVEGVRDTVGCWSHPGSYMGELSFQSVVDGRLHAALITSGDAKTGFSVVQMDGKVLKVGETVQFGAFSLTLTSSHQARVTVENYSMDVSNSDLFVNLALTATVPLSQLKSHGLIGQTHSIKTYKNTVKHVEGDVDEYVLVDGIMGHDFAFNQFQRQEVL